MNQIILVAITIVLMIGAPVVYAQTGALVSKHPQADFKSGYDQGVADASEPCNNPPPNTCNRYPYVWQSPHGFINQTDSWIDGYVTGFCKVAGPNASMDEPEAGFYCSDGPKSANWDIGPTIRGGGVDFHRDPKLQVTSK